MEYHPEARMDAVTQKPPGLLYWNESRRRRAVEKVR